MLSERLRALLSGTMLRVGAVLGRTGLSPNVFTIVGFIAVSLNAVLIALGYLPLAGIVLALSLLLDALARLKF